MSAARSQRRRSCGELAGRVRSDAKLVARRGTGRHAPAREKGAANARTERGAGAGAGRRGRFAFRPPHPRNPQGAHNRPRPSTTACPAQALTRNRKKAPITAPVQMITLSSGSTLRLYPGGCAHEVASAMVMSWTMMRADGRPSSAWSSPRRDQRSMADRLYVAADSRAGDASRRVSGSAASVLAVEALARGVGADPGRRRRHRRSNVNELQAPMDSWREGAWRADRARAIARASTSIGRQFIPSAYGRNATPISRGAAPATVLRVMGRLVASPSPKLPIVTVGSGGRTDRPHQVRAEPYGNDAWALVRKRLAREHGCAHQERYLGRVGGQSMENVRYPQTMAGWGGGPALAPTMH